MGNLKKGQEFLDTVATLKDGSARTKRFALISKKISVSLVTSTIANFSKTSFEIKYDEFRDEIVHSPYGKNEWKPFKDEDYTRLRIRLETLGIHGVGKELIRDAVILVAKEHTFDSAKEWIQNIVPIWDGMPRINDFFSRYFQAEDSEYSIAVSRYLWSALAGRVLNPGIKADMVPILFGEQGCGKSTGVASISPHPDFFTEINFNDKDDDLSRKMRGHLVGEIGELRGLNNKDVESIKAFVTRTYEKWIPKYLEYSTSFLRRIVFIGTTNQEQFLADQSGNRRWLPLQVGKVDLEALRRDRLQLWAEARDTFAGVMWEDAERLSREKHERHMIVDPWHDIIHDWLILNRLTPEYGQELNYGSHVTTRKILTEPLNMEPKIITKHHEMRAAGVLRALGFIKKSKRINGKPKNIYIHRDLYVREEDDASPIDETVYPF